MTTDEAIRLVKEEVARIESRYGPANTTRRPSEWVALFASRLGHLANAASAKNQVWISEEFVKLAATAVSAVTSVPTMSFASLGTEGLAVVDRGDTP